ncbi:hypothetical protein [Pedobacter sp.]|uniref:FKBP-type peptidyl-prolyl cis-trans isomerase n=1 Tax=Pedobacter sp. TaxID=1411316 RepID=UPI0031D964F0
MRKITNYLLALFSVLILFTSCKKEYETTEELDNRNIKNYKNAHPNLIFNDVDGYSYSITAPGTGSAVVNTDSIYYSYVFKSTSGTVYNQTSDLVIPGTLLGYADRFTVGGKAYSFSPVREVLGKLKRGGKATLLLPSRMAFGKNGLSNFGIGPNETIVVELGLYTFEKRHEVDNYEMSTFITRNNLTFNTDPSGIKFNVVTPGTGTKQIESGSNITANYTVRYLDGTVLQTGAGFSAKMDDLNLYKGWRIMLPGRLTAGGKLRMLLPAHLGDGVNSLDFDVEVVTVTD